MQVGQGEGGTVEEVNLEVEGGFPGCASGKGDQDGGGQDGDKREAADWHGSGRGPSMSYHKCIHTIGAVTGGQSGP